MAILEPNDTILEANDSGLSSTGQKNFFDSSQIDSQSDVDFISFQLDANDLVTINIDAREIDSSNPLDSVLRVFNATGKEMALNDDGTAPNEDFTYDSYLEFAPNATDDYYVGVSSYPNFNYDPNTENSGNGYSSGDYDIGISIFNGINGTAAKDNLSGTSDPDAMQGFGNNDTLTGAVGNDYLRGGDGNDVLRGDADNDLLLGGWGNDVLRGGIGDDVLRGEQGNDKLYGNQGADIFVLATGEGRDTIYNFEDSQDSFLIAGQISFEDLTIVNNSSGAATINYGSELLATVNGISSDLVTSDDFVSTQFLSPQVTYQMSLNPTSINFVDVIDTGIAKIDI